MLSRLSIAFINFFLWLAEIFLGLRFLLRFFAANPTNGFVNWVYSSTNVLLEPFRGIFSSAVVGHNHVVDFLALFAMAIYAVLAVALMAFVGLLGATARSAKGKRK